MKVSERSLELQGIAVQCITLSNDKGMCVEALNIGATITRIEVPNRWGNSENVVLAYEDWSKYIENKEYLGTLVGRAAGRIQGAKIRIGEKEHLLESNYGEDCGHGGFSGFHRKKLEYELFQTDRECGIHFYGESLDGEGGFPGSLKFRVTYVLRFDNVFEIQYEGETEKDTVLNLTNHSYFNLSGDFSESIKYHELYIDADNFAEIDAQGNVTGQLTKVSGTPFEFNFMHEIGEEMRQRDQQLEFGKGYDHAFLLNHRRRPSIRLVHRFSGRTLEIETDNQAVVVYTQNQNEHFLVKEGLTLEKQRSVALEVQRLPIGPKNVFLEHSLLKKEERYHQWTRYHFKVEL